MSIELGWCYCVDTHRRYTGSTVKGRARKEGRKEQGYAIHLVIFAHRALRTKQTYKRKGMENEFYSLISNFFLRAHRDQGSSSGCVLAGAWQTKHPTFTFKKDPPKELIADHHHHINREAVTPHFSNDDESKQQMSVTRQDATLYVSKCSSNKRPKCYIIKIIISLVLDIAL